MIHLHRNPSQSRRGMLAAGLPILLAALSPGIAPADANTSNTIALRAEPRLLVTPESFNRLPDQPQIPYLKKAAESVAEEATKQLDTPPVPFNPDAFNAHLNRARAAQTIVINLVVQWKRSGDKRFRDAAVAYIRQIGEWEYWSWITWREKKAEYDATFDLSYGENSATIALAYDLLHETLTPQEKTLFIRIARERAILPGLKHCKPGGMWWFAKPDSNWNTVCAGGLGMLCLAMYEDIPEAPALIPLVEQSFHPYIQYLRTTGGGWPEGLGYWNYGMRYAFMYLLSAETATGQNHPLLDIPEVAKTLSFPLDFTPNGTVCGFGDASGWQPLPFHYAMAQRLKQPAVLHAIHRRLEKRGIGEKAWPSEALFLALHPGNPPAPTDQTQTTGPVVRLYEGQDWGFLADRMPEPRIYISVRGGTTKVPHSHRDLLSFHLLVNQERLIRNLDGPPYIDTTFSKRREELFEITPASKNSLFINGVGIDINSSLDSTRPVNFDGVPGIRMEATSAMGPMRDGPAAKFCGRIFLILQDRAFLIVDCADLTHVGHFENRMHTFNDLTLGEKSATIRGAMNKLQIAYAANVPAQLRTAHTIPTLIQSQPATTLRWATPARHPHILFATLLAPGDTQPSLTLHEEKGIATITPRIGEWTQTIRVGPQLLPPE